MGICSFLAKYNNDAKRAPDGIQAFPLTVPKYLISRGIGINPRGVELGSKKSSGMRKIEYYRVLGH